MRFCPREKLSIRPRMALRHVLLTASRFLPAFAAPAASDTTATGPPADLPASACAPAHSCQAPHRQSRLAAHPADLAVFPSWMVTDRADLIPVPHSSPAPWPDGCAPPPGPGWRPSRPAAPSQGPLHVTRYSFSISRLGCGGQRIRGPVVGHQQQALGVHVQPPHRVHPCAAAGHQLRRRPPSPLIGQGGDIARGLFSIRYTRRVSRRRGCPSRVTASVSGSARSPRAAICPLTCTGPAAGSYICRRRSNSGGGYDLLQTLLPRILPVQCGRLLPGLRAKPQSYRAAWFTQSLPSCRVSGHQPPAVPFSGADQGPSRGSGAPSVFMPMHPGHRPQKPVMIGHGAPAHRNAPGGAQAHQEVWFPAA